METNLSGLLHLLSDEELIRLERRAILADHESIAEILFAERENRAAKDLIHTRRIDFPVVTSVPSLNALNASLARL